jgi:hypothetical protein
VPAQSTIELDLEGYGLTIAPVSVHLETSQEACGGSAPLATTQVWTLRQSALTLAATTRARARFLVVTSDDSALSVAVVQVCETLTP